MARLNRDKKAAPTATASATSRSIISSNKQEGLNRIRVVLHGPPGCGKTFCAATLSGKWPSRLPATKWTKLTDTLWVSVDTGATMGFLEQKIEVPQIVVDDLLSEYEVLGALELIQEAVQDAVSKGVKLVVIDTVSKLDKVLTSYWNDNPPLTARGAVDGFGIYRSVLATHRRFHAAINSLPCQVVFCCHTKARSADNPQAEARYRATAPPGIADLDLDLTGQALGLYRQDVRVIASVQKQGKERFLWVEPHAGFEAKNTFQLNIQGKQEPDLRKLMRKIERGLK